MVMDKKSAQKFVLPDEPIVPTITAPQAPQLSIEQAMMLAEKHQEAGRLQQAEHILRDILCVAPEYPKAIHLLGVVAYNAGKSDIAVNLIEKAISLDGKNALFHTNIAEMYRRMKKLDEAIEHGREAVKLNPKLLAAQSNLGIAYYDQEDYDKAEYHQNLALKIDPNFAPSLNNMGSILRAHEKYEEACDWFKKAIAAAPQFLDPQNNLGEVLVRLDRPEEGLELLNRVLAVNPRYDSALSNRGTAFLALGKEIESRNNYLKALHITPDFIPAVAGLIMWALEFHKLEEGEKCARRLVELAPDKADSNSMLGSVLFAQGRTEEAEACYTKAVALDPDYVPAKAGIGHVLMEQGDLSGAEELFRSCIDAEKEQASAICSLVQCRKMKPGDPEIKLLEREAEKLKGKMIDSKAIPLNFALGKMYDDLGEYDKGFPYYIEGCRLKRKYFDYTMGEKEANIEHIKQVFSKEFIAKNTGQGHRSNTPIFVLGMPRSGTTLVEQIIASHPQVYGAGELRDLMEVTDAMVPAKAGMRFSEKMTDLKPGDYADLGRKYVEGLKARNPDSPRITDKMPGNFHYVGLIKMILPEAKIVHVKRHPLDTCISCFTRLFAHGQASTYDLKEVGHYYKCYKGLMDHWRTVLPAGSFYEIKYEEVVDDIEDQARKLIEYCGLPWDDSCLEFYKNKRSIRTASVTQVRQPIYKTSKQRWKNYEKFLGPMIEGLGDALPPQT